MGKGFCFECGAKAEHFHHVVPRSMGGTKTVPLCEKCHSKIHNHKMLHTTKLTKSGLARNKKEGKKTGGDIPFGYDLSENGRLVINQKEQDEISRILALRDKEKISFQKIADFLNDRGIKTKKGKVWNRQIVNGLYKRVST
jgi:hypothetical protein